MPGTASAVGQKGTGDQKLPANPTVGKWAVGKTLTSLNSHVLQRLWTNISRCRCSSVGHRTCWNWASREENTSHMGHRVCGVVNITLHAAEKEKSRKRYLINLFGVVCHASETVSLYNLV